MKNVTAILACAVAIALAAPACERAPADADRPNEPAATSDAVGTSGDSPAGTVRVAELMTSPDEYFGKTVTVVADVEEVYGPNAFALDEDAPVAGGIDNDLLVFSKKAGTLADIDDQWLNNKVRVTGTVGKMTVVELEREIGWDLDRQIEVEVEKAGAVLVASSISRTQ
jgi:hypothetical protein